MQLVFLPVLVYQYWNAGSSLQCSIVWMHSCHYPTVFSFTNKGKGYCLCKYSGNYRQCHIHGYGFQTPYQRDIIWKVWCNPWQHLYSMQTKPQQEHLTTNSQNAPGGKLQGSCRTSQSYGHPNGMPVVTTIGRIEPLVVTQISQGLCLHRPNGASWQPMPLLLHLLS